MSLFDDIATENRDQSPFLQLDEGSHVLVIVTMPTETRTSDKIKFGSKDRLYIKVVAPSGKYATWSVPYSKSVGTKSVLGQLKVIYDEQKLSAWEGVALKIVKVGTGKNTRYSISYEKTLDSKQMKKLIAKADEASAESVAKESGSALDHID